jgi:hypothetical protein
MWGGSTEEQAVYTCAKNLPKDRLPRFITAAPGMAIAIRKRGEKEQTGIGLY